MKTNCNDDLNLCPIRKVLTILGSKWAFVIVMVLKEPKRFNELKRAIPDISEKVLIDKLRLLEVAGFVNRKDFKEIPPRVEYSLTKSGKEVFALLPQLSKIGKGLM